MALFAEFLVPIGRTGIAGFVEFAYDYTPPSLYANECTLYLLSINIMGPP